MFLKLIYTLLLISFGFSQSYFNRIIGDNIQFGDARSMGLADTYVSTGVSSNITAVNPARLSYLLSGEKGFSFDIQAMSKSYFERRDIVIVDSFDDFLTNTDYVSNQQGDLYNSFGFIISNSEIHNSNIAIGFSLMPLASFNYLYEEEVRGETSLDDGEIGIKDPLLGFHRYQNKGEINLFSLGFGYFHAPSSVALGFSINRILKSTIEDVISIEKYIHQEEDIDYTNLSNVQDIQNKFSTPYETYETFSAELPCPYSQKSAFILSIETAAVITSKDYSGYDNSGLSGLPFFLEYDTDNEEYNFVLKGIEFYKPKKMTFGLKLDKHRTLFIFEINKEYYNKYDVLLNDLQSYKFAFEYRFKLGPSIRMGLSYKESIIKTLYPITKFTLGSNKKIDDNFNIDFGLSYHITNYKYDDIFPTSVPINNLDCSKFCETVNEGSISLSTTLKWKF